MSDMNSEYGGELNPGAMMDDFAAIKKALLEISDTGNVDSGMGLGSADYWVTINGTDYFITAKIRTPTGSNG